MVSTVPAPAKTNKVFPAWMVALHFQVVLQILFGRKVQSLIDKMVEVSLLAGPHHPAVQIANLLLRWCVPSKCTHLLRILPPEHTADFSQDIDQGCEKNRFFSWDPEKSV